MHFYESVPERRYPSIKLEFVLFPVLKRRRKKKKSKKEKKEKKERRKRRGKKSKKKGSYSTMKTAF